VRFARIVLPLLVILLAAGCTRVVDGTVRPARGLAPRPLTGQTVRQVLLDDSELWNATGQRFKARAEFPPRFGGRDLLSPLSTSPSACAGVVFELDKSGYEAANVGTVAQESWWTVGVRGVQIIHVSEAVVVLPSAVAADALFAKFTQDWNQCNGATVHLNFPSGGDPTAAVSDVRAADSVLAATVESFHTLISARAVGVRVNCLVEVDVAFFHHPDGTAVKIAHRMMDKVSSLS
jgi:hypothetical protein